MKQNKFGKLNKSRKKGLRNMQGALNTSMWRNAIALSFI